MNQMLSLQPVSDTDIARVVAIIAQQAMIDPSQIAAHTPLADLALDSLVMVEIVFALEEAFGVSIPFNAQDMGQGAAGFDMSTPAAIAAAIGALRPA
jgi:acyl carrier protein